MPPPRAPRPPAQRAVVIGHRGASGYRPEHSRAAYQLAIELGADAVEPDLVVTRDGVLVVRHENEISGTTDVAAHPEFAGRRTTKEVDGQRLTGWFTEDFTWPELATLRAIERLPRERPRSARYDGAQPILRFDELLSLLDAAPRPVGLVAEIKHPTYFEGIGLPLDGLVAEALAGWSGRPGLVVECFEQTVLGRLRDRGLAATRVYLCERSGSAADLRARLGSSAPSYAEQLNDAGLAALAGEVDGVSVDKALLFAGDGATTTDLVARVHAAGLLAYTWTLRPENRFLAPAHRGEGGKTAWGDWRAEFAAILATGVDGVFADHPDLAVAARDGRDHGTVPAAGPVAPPA